MNVIVSSNLNCDEKTFVKWCPESKLTQLNSDDRMDIPNLHHIWNVSILTMDSISDAAFAILVSNSVKAHNKNGMSSFAPMKLIGTTGSHTASKPG